MKVIEFSTILVHTEVDTKTLSHIFFTNNINGEKISTVETGIKSTFDHITT